VEEVRPPLAEAGHDDANSVAPMAYYVTVGLRNYAAFHTRQPKSDEHAVWQQIFR